MPQALEDLVVVGLVVVLDGGQQDDQALAVADFGPQVVEAARLHHLIEIVLEPLKVAVMEFVLPEACAGRAEPDPGLGDDPELSLAAPHRIEEPLVLGGRAPDPLTGAGHHLELLDLLDLHAVTMRGGADSPGGERSAHCGLSGVHQHRRQPTSALQRVHYVAPPRPALGPHQLRADRLDPVQACRVEDHAPIGQGPSALGVPSSPNGQRDPFTPSAAHKACQFLHALRRGHRLRHPPGHPSEIEGACLPVFQNATCAREEMVLLRHSRMPSDALDRDYYRPRSG